MPPATSAGRSSAPCRGGASGAARAAAGVGRGLGGRAPCRSTTCPGRSTRRRASWPRRTTRRAPTRRTRRSSASTGSTATGPRASSRCSPGAPTGTSPARWRSRPTGSASRGATCATSSWRRAEGPTGRAAARVGRGRGGRTRRRHRSTSCSSPSWRARWRGRTRRTGGAGRSAAGSDGPCRAPRSVRGRSAGLSAGCGRAAAWSSSRPLWRVPARRCASGTGRIRRDGHGATSGRCDCSTRSACGGRSTASSTSVPCRSAATRTRRRRPGCTRSTARESRGDREPANGHRPRRSRAQPLRAGRRAVREPALAALRRPVRALAARRGRADRLVARRGRRGGHRPAAAAPREGAPTFGMPAGGAA